MNNIGNSKTILAGYVMAPITISLYVLRTKALAGGYNRGEPHKESWLPALYISDIYIFLNGCYIRGKIKKFKETHNYEAT
jgi:hypothetical protein